jgi:hypothetical protein
MHELDRGLWLDRNLLQQRLWGELHDVPLASFC